ncbi:L-rhamnose mutarotase [Streptomyces sp. NPDC051105]|uniref:L-rhamnose mutarotase n=1 Tax=Streptomyces sp. NPDC051105 TaxID=3154843 RepID=UPI00343A8174
MTATPHTTVRAARIPASEATHRELPVELTEAIRAVGAGADHGRLLAELEKLPVDAAWQARTAELLDVVHHHSEAGPDVGLPVVGELP